MIEEAAKVVAVEEGHIWAETVRQSSCGQCSAKASCGQKLLAKRQASRPLRLPNTLSLQVGDDIVIGVAEQAILKSSILLYLLPLLGLLGGLLIAQRWHNEALSLLCALMGFVMTLVGVRCYTRGLPDDSQYEPVILRRVLCPKS